MTPCALIHIDMIGGPVHVCTLPEGHEHQVCRGRPRDKRTGEVVPGPELRWYTERSYMVAGEYVRRADAISPERSAP